MIIGACGYSGTGSSAITDLLKEYRSVWTFDTNEFVLVHNPDGIEDLEFQLFDHFTKYTSSAVAIERFRRAAYFILKGNVKDRTLIKKNSDAIEEFINSIVQVRWNGCGFVDNQLYATNHYKNKLLHRTFSKIRLRLNKVGLAKISEDKQIMPVHEMNLSVRPENFILSAKRLITTILSNYGADFSKAIVLDQPFAGNDPTRSFKYFGDDCRAIVVDRDPRDLFVFFNYAVKKKPTILFEPISDVKKFAIYYRTLRENIVADNESSNVLRINLADLVYKYDETKTAIEEFCGLNPDDWISPQKYLNPSISISNTQIFRRFPEFADQIKYIESELKEYLYPYDKYISINTDGDIMINKTGEKI